MSRLHYKMKLIVESPIYIGCLDRYTKLDYFENDNYIYIINHQKLFPVLEKEGLMDDYLYAVKNEQENIKYHRKNKYSPDLINNFYVNNASHLQEALLYKVPIVKRNRVGEINAFVKTIDYKPYIPGSSIKGAIVTAIREEYKLDSKTKIDGISISDTELATLEDLIVIERIDTVIYERKKFQNNLRIFNECLKEGTELTFNITLDLLKLNKTVPQIKSIDDVLKAINARYKRIINILNLTGIAYDYTIDKSNLLFLGGHAGFHTKTIIASNPYVVREKTKKILIKRFPKGKHYKDDIISPRTYKLVNTYNGLLFSGLARLEVIK